MGLALDGIIAGQRLPPCVKRIAAGNPVDQAAGGWELAPSLANRFVHLSWSSPDAGSWTAWLTGTAAGDGALRPVVMQRMQHWQSDSDLKGVRGPEALAKLPEAERQEWQKLWAEVDELRQKATKPAK
jgi:hypothetical protein